MNYIRQLLDWWSFSRLYCNDSNSSVNAVLYEKRSELGASYRNQTVTEFEPRNYSSESCTSHSPLDTFDIALIQSLYNPSNSNQINYAKLVPTILNHIPDISALVPIDNGNGGSGLEMSALDIVSHNDTTLNVLRGTLDRPEYGKYFDSIGNHILTDTTSFKWIDTHLKPMSLFKYEIQEKFVQLVDQILIEHRKSLGAEYLIDDDNETTTSNIQYTKHISIENYPIADLLDFDIYLSKCLVIILENSRNINCDCCNFGDLLFRHISNYNVKFDYVEADFSIVTSDDYSTIAGVDVTNVDVDVDAVTAADGQQNQVSIKSYLVSYPRIEKLSHPDCISHFTDLFDQFVMISSSEAESEAESELINQLIQDFNFLDIFEWEIIKSVLSDLSETFVKYRSNLGGKYNHLEIVTSNKYSERYEASVVASYDECSVGDRQISGSLAQFDFHIIRLFNKIFDLSLDSRRSKSKDLMKGFLINHIADFYMSENSGVTDDTILHRILSNQDPRISAHLFRLPDSFHYFKDFFSKIVEKDADWLEPRLGFFQKFSKEIQVSAIDKIDLQIKQYRADLDEDPLKEAGFDVSLVDGVKILLSFKGIKCSNFLVKMLCNNISNLSARIGSENKDSVFSLLLDDSSSINSDLDLDFYKETFEHPNYMEYYESFFDDIILNERFVDNFNFNLKLKLNDSILVIRSLQLFTVKIQQSIAGYLNQVIRSHRQQLGAVYLNDDQVSSHDPESESELLVSFDTYLVKLFGIFAKYKEASLLSDTLLNHIPDFDFKDLSNINNPILSVFAVIEREKLLHNDDGIIFNRIQLREYFKKFMSCVVSNSASTQLRLLLNRFLLFGSKVKLEIIGYISDLIMEHRSGLGAEYYFNEGGSQVTSYVKRDFTGINKNKRSSLDLDPSYDSSSPISQSQKLICFDYALLEAFKIIVNFKNQKYISLIKMLLNHISDPITPIISLPIKESAFAIFYQQYHHQNNLGGSIDRPDLKFYFLDYIKENYLFKVKQYRYSVWLIQFFVPLYFMTPSIKKDVLDTLDSHIRTCRIDLGAHYTKIGDRFIPDYNDPTDSHSSTLKTLDTITLAQLCRNDLTGGSVAKIILDNAPKLIEDRDIQNYLCNNTGFNGKIRHSEEGQWFLNELVEIDFEMFVTLFKVLDAELCIGTIHLLNERIYNHRIRYGGLYTSDTNDNSVARHAERRFTLADNMIKIKDLGNHKVCLVHLDLHILSFLKYMSDMKNFENLALFKMFLNHTPDLKATHSQEKVSPLSLIINNDFLFKNMRGSVHREESEIAVYFKQFLEGSAGLKGGDKRVDFDLLALALFTPEIQRTVIKQFINYFPNTKNWLLHLVLFYRLDEQVFFDLIDAGAQLLVLTKEDYDKSKISKKNDIIFANNMRYIPSGAFNESCSEEHKSLYVDFDVFTNNQKDGVQKIRGSDCKTFFSYMYKSNSSNYNFSISYGRDKMDYDYVSETSSLRAAFNNYGPDLVLTLLEMASFKFKEQTTGTVGRTSLYRKQVRYNLARLIVNNQNQSKNAYLPPIEELLDFEAAIERLHSGTPDTMSIVILSKLSLKVDYMSIINSFIEKSHLGHFKGGSSYHVAEMEDLNAMGLLYLPIDTLEDIILTACRSNLPEDAFNRLVEATFIGLCKYTANGIFFNALKIAKNIKNESKIAVLNEKIACINLPASRMEMDYA